MNVYLRLLVKPHKKEKLLVSNNVLKLASKLLKVNVSYFDLTHLVLAAGWYPHTVAAREAVLCVMPSGKPHAQLTHACFDVMSPVGAELAQ